MLSGKEHVPAECGESVRGTSAGYLVLLLFCRGTYVGVQIYRYLTYLFPTRMAGKATVLASSLKVWAFFADDVFFIKHMLPK